MNRLDFLEILYKILKILHRISGIRQNVCPNSRYSAGCLGNMRYMAGYQIQDPISDIQPTIMAEYPANLISGSYPSMPLKLSIYQKSFTSNLFFSSFLIVEKKTNTGFKLHRNVRANLSPSGFNLF